jgi:hypothetical protein
VGSEEEGVATAEEVAADSGVEEVDSGVAGVDLGAKDSRADLPISSWVSRDVHLIFWYLGRSQDCSA